MVTWRWYAAAVGAVATLVVAGAFGWWAAGVAVAILVAVRKH